MHTIKTRAGCNWRLLVNSKYFNNPVFVCSHKSTLQLLFYGWDIVSAATHQLVAPWWGLWSETTHRKVKFSFRWDTFIHYWMKLDELQSTPLWYISNTASNNRLYLRQSIWPDCPEHVSSGCRQVITSVTLFKKDKCVGHITSQQSIMN